MKHIFTQLQLTRLVYGETTKAETDMLMELILTVPALAASHDELERGKATLGGDRFIPTDLSINRIMAYSAATAPVSAN